MARGDPTYAHIDVTWPDDPRSKGLSAAENWLYEVCVLSAVHARRNCLPPAYDVSYLCRRAVVRRSTWDSLIRKAAEMDAENPIIWINPEGRICLPSIGKRHAKLDWKDEREGPHPSPHGADAGPKTSPPPSPPPTVPPSRKRAAKKPAADSPAQGFLKWYAGQFEIQFGHPYPVNWSKECSQVKEMLKTYDLGTLKTLAIRLFASKDEWVSGTGRGIGVLRSQLAKLIAAKPVKKTTADADAEADRLRAEQQERFRREAAEAMKTVEPEQEGGG